MLLLKIHTHHLAPDDHAIGVESSNEHGNHFTKEGDGGTDLRPGKEFSIPRGKARVVQRTREDAVFERAGREAGAPMGAAVSIDEERSAVVNDQKILALNFEPAHGVRLHIRHSTEREKVFHGYVFRKILFGRPQTGQA